MRIGIGYDVHRFAPGRQLVLGGVRIPYAKGLAGHSDADVLVHAVMDAILGALSLGDIGQHFPDSDESYKNIDSMRLLEQVRLMAADQGYRVGNLDTVIVAQEPKLAPYILTMRQKLSSVLQVSDKEVSVKATTTEKLGFCGRGEGVAAQAVVLLSR